MIPCTKPTATFMIRIIFFNIAGHGCGYAMSKKVDASDPQNRPTISTTMSYQAHRISIPRQCADLPAENMVLFGHSLLFLQLQAINSYQFIQSEQDITNTYCQFIATDLFLRFFGFEVISDDTSVLQYFQENIFLFQENLRKECTGNCSLPAGVNVNVYISVRSPYIPLKWHTNESYSLNVINRGILYFYYL